jgi:hypothetical protein
MYVTLSPYKDNKNMEKMQENQWFFKNNLGSFLFGIKVKRE